MRVPRPCVSVSPAPYFQAGGDLSRTKVLKCVRSLLPISFPSLHGREHCPTGPPPTETHRCHVHMAETKRGCQSGANALVWLRATISYPKQPVVFLYRLLEEQQFVGGWR